MITDGAVYNNDLCVDKMDMETHRGSSKSEEEAAGTLLVSHVTDPHYTHTSPNQVFITLGIGEKSI